VIEIAVSIALVAGFVGIFVGWYALRKLNKLSVWDAKREIGILECEIYDLRKHLMKIKR
jgi:hypothetical protein